MRKTLLTLPLLLGCPVTEGISTDNEKTDVKIETKTEEKTDPSLDKPATDVSIFGFEAETASYKKGKDGAPDTLDLTLGDEGGQVYSSDGKHTADILKIVESNLFPDTVVVLPPQLKGAKALDSAKAHAWLVWMEDKQAEIALSNPLYSAGAGTIKFDVEVVDGTLPEGSLGKVELNLQDCPDQDYECAKFTLEACGVTTGKVGTCWSWPALNCLPCNCDGDMAVCKEKDPKCCGDADAPCYPSRLGPNGWERYCL